MHGQTHIKFTLLVDKIKENVNDIKQHVH